VDPRFLGDFGTAGYDFSRAVTRIVRRAIPFEGTCLLTFDPSTMLPTGEVVEYGLPTAAMARLSEARRPHFTPTEVRFAASLAGPLAEGLRRAAHLADARDDDDHHNDDRDTGHHRK
jgi:hypothetical protein